MMRSRVTKVKAVSERLKRIRTCLQEIYMAEERRGIGDPYGTIDFGLETLGVVIDDIGKSAERLSRIGSE